MGVLPWEQLLWRQRAWRFPGASYMLTDFRVVSGSRAGFHELALEDIADVQRLRTPLDRLLRTSTLVLHSRRPRVPPITLRGVRRGIQLAALLELLSGDARGVRDRTTVQAMLSWTPDPRPFGTAARVGGLFLLAMTVSTVVIGLHGKSPGVEYPAGDAIFPGGVKRDREHIARFMEDEVLPWARATFGPLKGGAENVSCATCHGAEPESRNWAMPAVGALPEPDVHAYGSEAGHAIIVDAQMRNAMYGYLAQSESQIKAGYMRQVVVPEMAALLGRPPYDFTKSYEYNRRRFAFGCYHCHQVQQPSTLR